MRIINTRKAEVVGLLMIIVGVALALQLCSHPVAAQDKPNNHASAPAVEAKPKSYPLPEALATQIEKLAKARDTAYTALLEHVGNPKIYQQTDNSLRMSVFDRQQRLYTEFQESIANLERWIIEQRKEFKCDTCEAQRTPDGKWSFVERVNPEGAK